MLVREMARNEAYGSVKKISTRMTKMCEAGWMGKFTPDGRNSGDGQPAACQGLGCRLSLYLEFVQVQTRVKEEVPMGETLMEDGGQVGGAKKCKKYQAVGRGRREVVRILLCACENKTKQ